MPYIRINKCVYKRRDKKRGKKKGCSSSITKAKKYLKKLYMVDESDELESKIQKYLKEGVKSFPNEIKDYFNQKIDDEYLKFDDHPQASLEKLLNEEEPPPWDYN